MDPSLGGLDEPASIECAYLDLDKTGENNIQLRCHSGSQEDGATGFKMTELLKFGLAK